MSKGVSRVRRFSLRSLLWYKVRVFCRPGTRSGFGTASRSGMLLLRESLSNVDFCSSLSKAALRLEREGSVSFERGVLRDFCRSNHPHHSSPVASQSEEDLCRRSQRLSALSSFSALFGMSLSASFHQSEAALQLEREVRSVLSARSFGIFAALIHLTSPLP